MNILTQNNGRGNPKYVIYIKDYIIQDQDAVRGTFKEVYLDSGGYITHPFIITM